LEDCGEKTCDSLPPSRGGIRAAEFRFRSHAYEQLGLGVAPPAQAIPVTTGSSWLGRKRRKGGVKRREVTMIHFWLIQGCSPALDPCMCFKRSSILAKSHAQFRSNALPCKEPPKCKRYHKAGRVPDSLV